MKTRHPASIDRNHGRRRYFQGLASRVSATLVGLTQFAADPVRARSHLTTLRLRDPCYRYFVKAGDPSAPVARFTATE